MAVIGSIGPDLFHRLNRILQVRFRREAEDLVAVPSGDDMQYVIRLFLKVKDVGGDHSYRGRIIEILFISQGYQIMILWHGQGIGIPRDAPIHLFADLWSLECTPS